MPERAPRTRRAYVLATALGGVALAVALADDDRVALGAALVLTAAAAAGDLAASRLAVQIYTSPVGVAIYVAAVRYGAPTALIVVVAGLLLAWGIQRYRPVALLSNMGSLAVPAVLAALVVDALGGHDQHSTGLLGAAVAATLAAETVNLALGGLLFALYDGVPLRSYVRSVRELAASFALEAGFVAVLAVADARSHVEALVLAALLVAVYAYMSRLVTRAYAQSALAAARAQRYADLSLGVLSSLVHTLGARDPRAARHCAAVARYARDLTAALGHDEREQELAHTAGLLHDIGRFTLSDRVLDGDRALTDEDWQQIHEHPQRGAELLRDLDAYGPIAEIVAAHHEQVGGHGYPLGLRGEEIPLLSRVIAVCEVYDTLTAPDTYRAPPLSSFEALRELRRVAGIQLDARMVEAFAALLAGTDTDYRHATAVDYDAELEVQRAMADRLEGKAPLL